MEVKLVMFKANGQRREFPIDPDGVTTIGRDTECDLRIPLSTVSREHCQVSGENGVLHVRDLGSSNGTFLNNQRIQESAFSAGDQLRVGPVIFIAVIDGAPALVEPVLTVVGEGSVEPVNHAGEDIPTIDADVLGEASELSADAISALQEMTRPKE